jgi:hypothetical protein
VVPAETTQSHNCGIISCEFLKNPLPFTGRGFFAITGTLKGVPLKKIIPVLLISMIALAGCGSVTTATEPTFTSISSEEASAADADLYAALAALDPTPADPIELAIAIDGLDPADLPEVPGAPVQTYQVGDTRTFWTHNSDTFETNEITAELMAISKHAYFWQDQASEALNATNEPATAEDWAAAAESFDQSYERVRAVFGQEESPGLDGDLRLFVINSDSLGMVGGYFGQNDRLPAIMEPYSNEGQYFYISNTWASGIASDYYKEVLAHEFQHMIQKNMDPNEEGWLNEGFSMLAQQVAGMGGDNSVADYLIKPDQSLWYWSGESMDYGQSYLYVDYLYEQIGEEFIKAIASDPANGLASIDQNLVQFDSPRNADELYADAMMAVYFDNPALAEGQYAFQHPVLPLVLPRYDFATVPAVYQGTVEQYGGVDMITISCDGTASIAFSGNQRAQLIPAEAYSGEHFWWSNRYDSTFATLTRQVDLAGISSATLTFRAWYDIEEDWDYAYILVSTDGGRTWVTLPSTSSRETDPNNQNLGHGLSGISGDDPEATWSKESIDLSAYAGKQILLRFAMQNDLVVNNAGFAIDDIAIPETGWSDDAESGNQGWISEGFILSHNHVPQVWSVRAVEKRVDGTIVVHEIEITDGEGQLKLESVGMQKLVLFVIGQTRYTTMPASYRLEVKR